MLYVVSEDTERVIGERRMATLRDLGSDPSVVRTEQETLEFAGRQLDRNRRDLPFTVTYLFDNAGGTARLAESTGIAAGHPAAPAALAAGDPDPVWPVAALLRGESAVVDLDSSRFAGLPAGPWTRATARSSASWPDTSRRGSRAHAATRTSSAARRSSPNWTAPRPRSSPTSATSSAPR